MRVEIDWAPAYEVFASLHAYTDTQRHKLFELGPGWVRTVREGLPKHFESDLQALRRLAGGRLKKEGEPSALLLARRCPGERTAEQLVDWLASLSPGDLYELAAPYAGDHLPSDLGEIRDAELRILRAWHKGYFSRLDPAILDGLAAEARTRQAALDRLVGGAAADAGLLDFVEETSGGLRYESLPEGADTILLVPQYHGRPLNLLGAFGPVVAVQYPSDVLPPAEGFPSDRVLRQVRALADESRLRILRYLGEGPKTFTEIVGFAGLVKSTVYHHLVILRAAGLVRVHIRSGEVDRYTPRLEALDSIRNDLRDFFNRGPDPSST